MAGYLYLIGYFFFLKLFDKLCIDYRCNRFNTCLENSCMCGREFWIEMLIAQPIARYAMKSLHARQAKKVESVNS